MSRTQQYDGLKASLPAFHGSVRRAVIVRNRRDAALWAPPETTWTLRQRLMQRSRTIPLSYDADPAVEAVVARLRAEHPRRRNWNHVEPTCRSSSIILNKDWNAWRTAWPRLTYTPCIECWARPFGRRLYWHFDGQVQIICAPRGYRWDADADGVRLVARNGADYHPDALDLRLGPEHCRRRLRANERRRREERRRTRREERIIRRASRHGWVWVCLRDALAAGHCRAGCVAWAERHGLDPRGHYRPVDLLSQTNGDTHQVALAVRWAERRTAREIERGYCVVKEHDYAR